MKIPKNVLGKDVLGQDINRQKRLTSKDKSEERRKSKKDKRAKTEELRYFIGTILVFSDTAILARRPLSMRPRLYSQNRLR